MTRGSGDARHGRPGEKARRDRQPAALERDQLLARELRDHARHRLAASADLVAQLLLSRTLANDRPLRADLAFLASQARERIVKPGLDIGERQAARESLDPREPALEVASEHQSG